MPHRERPRSAAPIRPDTVYSSQILLSGAITNLCTTCAFAVRRLFVLPAYSNARLGNDRQGNDTADA